MKDLKTHQPKVVCVRAITGESNVQRHERYSASVEDKDGQADCGQLDHGLLNDRMTDLIETAKTDCRVGWIF